MFQHFSDPGYWLDMLYVVPAALIAIMGHESSHALAAYWLGDPTARDYGRVSFNPLRHIDPFGLLMLIIAGFGWAKPVPIDTRHFQKPKRDMALSAAAGPVSNFLLAFVFLLVEGILVFSPADAPQWLLSFLSVSVMLNIGLGVFNLFPIPPLDGSKIFGALLPDRAYYTLLSYERYGMFILMALLVVGVLDAPLSALRAGVYDAMESAVLALTSWLR